MKRAIGYSRISTKDQSNFSLSGQSKYIQDHCSKNDIELVAMFTDDGRSAKNFDRPDWQKLESFIKKNHESVDFLIVAKYDRFSRNVSEALQMIERLEHKYSIKIMSVMENIALHPSSPYFFQFRTQMLVGAHVELLVIKDRTQFGLHQAAKAGRIVNRAPIGYKNSRDEKNKPIIVLDEAKAPFVKKAFNLFISGMPLEAVRREMAKRGFKTGGNSFYQRMFTNPVYAGLVKVNAYYDEPEKIIKAIHEPIISEEIWWKAQAILKGRTCTHVIQRDEVPLRGTLKCFCNRLLTAGNSRSKSGKYIWYYKCNTHKQYNLSAKKLHQQFDEILKELSLSALHVQYLQKRIVEHLKTSLADKEKEHSAVNIQLKALIGKIESLEEKWISNDIDKSVYSKWKVKYENERIVLSNRLADLRQPITKVWDRFNIKLQQLADLAGFYNQANIAQKQSFIQVVFDNQLYYQDSIYRTPYIHPLFASKALILKEKRLLELEQPSLILSEFERCSENGS